MKHCSHTHWLNLACIEDDLFLQKSDRLARLVDQVIDQDEARPSLCIILGNKTKSKVLRHVFGIKRTRFFRNRRHPGELHLNISPSTVGSEKPLFVADGAMAYSATKIGSKTNKCHVIENLALHRPQAEAQFVSKLYRLLSPFADVYCIFATDIGGFRQVACLVASWLEQMSMMYSAVPLPQLVVVTDKIPLGKRSEQEARRALLSLIAEETRLEIFSCFSDLEVVSTYQKRLSSTEQLSVIRGRILQASENVRSTREASRKLFSAVHFSAFFDLACAHFSTKPDIPFDFVKASRVDNPITPDLTEHLSNFIRLVKHPDELLTYAIPMLSSSLLLDSFPPDAHVFSALDVFSTLYRDALSRIGDTRVIAFQDSEQILLRTGLVNLVQQQFERDFQTWISKPAMTAVEFHRQTMSRFFRHHKTLDSTRTCLPCLKSEPSICLPDCKHCVCLTCVELYVDPDADGYCHIYRCFYCGTELSEKVTVKIHSPTRGIGLICIDGGGMKGLIPLRVMQLLESKIRHLIHADLPLPTFVRVGFGVSVGALILAATFQQGLSPNETAEKFRTLAEAVFSSRSLLSRIRGLAKLCFGPGMYSSEKIEKLMKEFFGSNTSILDPSYATAVGAKLGFPVATVDGRPSSRIFTNYVRPALSGENFDSEGVIRPREGLGRVLLWQIARAVSAAPGIFAPQHIPLVGTFQDHGPLENDPILSAMTETRKIYPHIEEPDFILSLGTGDPTDAKSLSEEDGSHRARVSSGLLRLGQLFWEKSRDKKARQIFSNNPRYLRFDVKFNGTEPRLDSLENLDNLETLVTEDESLAALGEDFARRAVASLFYFELAQKMHCADRRYEGKGFILCALEPSDPAFKPLVRYLEKVAAKFYVDDTFVAKVHAGIRCLGDDGRFHVPVQLEVGERFEITIDLGETSLFPISASPFTIKMLETLQGLTAYFGRPNHRKRPRPEIESCQPSKRIKA